jgi:hypothetical protein
MPTRADIEAACAPERIEGILALSSGVVVQFERFSAAQAALAHGLTIGGQHFFAKPSVRIVAMPRPGASAQTTAAMRRHEEAEQEEVSAEEGVVSEEEEEGEESVAEKPVEVPQRSSAPVPREPPASEPGPSIFGKTTAAPPGEANPFAMPALFRAPASVAVPAPVASRVPTADSDEQRKLNRKNRFEKKLD